MQIVDVNVSPQQPPPVPHREFPHLTVPNPSPVNQTPSSGKKDRRPGQANIKYSGVHLNGEVCMHDIVHVTFHVLLPPSPYIFSLSR